jgi:hypothetical protein
MKFSCSIKKWPAKIPGESHSTCGTLHKFTPLTLSAFLFCRIERKIIVSSMRSLNRLLKFQEIIKCS